MTVGSRIGLSHVFGVSADIGSVERSRVIPKINRILSSCHPFIVVAVGNVQRDTRRRAVASSCRRVQPVGSGNERRHPKMMMASCHPIICSSGWPSATCCGTRDE